MEPQEEDYVVLALASTIFISQVVLLAIAIIRNFI